MKPLWLKLLSLVILFISSLLFGHSGRTDSNGGHYNRTTGLYHFHHGYGEHQHPNGECSILVGTKKDKGFFDIIGDIFMYIIFGAVILIIWAFISDMREI